MKLKSISVKILSFILSLTFVVSSLSIPVYASSTKSFDDVVNQIEDYLNRGCGWIFNFDAVDRIAEDVLSQINSAQDEHGGAGHTRQDAIDAIPDDISSDPNIVNYINIAVNNIKQEYGTYYCYSTPLSSFLSEFASPNAYNSALNIIKNAPADAVKIWSPNRWVVLVYSDYPFDFVVRRDESGASSSYPMSMWPYFNWFSWSRGEAQQLSGFRCDVYTYSSSADSFILDINRSWTYDERGNDPYNYASKELLVTNKDGLFATNWGYNTYGNQRLVDIGSKSYKYYLNENAMKAGSVGVPLYYQIDNSSNYNKVDSDNVWNYVNNYYSEHNEYPSNDEINTYIINYHPEDNNNGGDNGNGSGGGSGTSVGVGGVVQNANPVINVYNNIRIKLSSLFGEDIDVEVGDDDPNNPTDPNNPSVTPTPSPGTDPGTGTDPNAPQCICTEKCDKDHINTDCPVCSQNYKNCKGKSKSLLDKFKDAVGSLIGGIADFLTDVIVDAFKLIVDGIVGVKGEDGHYHGGILGSIRTLIEGLIGTENPETGEREGGIPNTIGQLLGYFLGNFFPPEITALITLFITVSLIIGIIKLIRGR